MRIALLEYDGEDWNDVLCSDGDKIEQLRARIREAEVDPQQLAAPYESRAGVAWLRKDGDRVVLVDLDRKVSRQPTAEELETGAYFADFEEYRAANGLTDDRSAAA